MMKALSAQKILTEEGWRNDLALVMEGGMITALTPLEMLPDDMNIERLAGGALVPGFVDIQANGGGGVMFNDCTSLADLEKMAKAHRRFGTTSLLPTVISDDFEVMVRCAALVSEAIRKGLPGIRGIHFEGPYLNPAKKGVHDAAKLRAVDPGFFELATQKSLGHVLVTLAPERVLLEDIALFAGAGIRVSAGHSIADYGTAKAAFKAGVTGITHLFNAMPPMESRAPGIIGAALETADVYCGIIADGHHVHPATLKAAIGAKGAGHMMLVTDAMATVGTDMTGFSFGGSEILLKDGRLATRDGVLAGSALDMARAVRNTAGLLGQSEAAALSMASSVPAAFLGLDAGRIAVGARADLLLLDNAGSVQKCWIGGQEQPL
ncbi:MAG: N-acetylglucosamine-6-phosphate deacetylase [Alphaproteobacteria bacterium]|nr:MAG: N-acetylglucosamine-6-phosphate deacetylase [Alphaproteobacteria bacterium]